MIKEFENLETTEIEFMKSVPALVSILIAGADDKIQKSEIKEAQSLANIKQNKARTELLAYYNHVAPEFENIINDLLNKFPANPEERSQQIVEELKKVNLILPKLNNEWAAKFVDSMKDFARKVAEAAGGVFGYLSIGYEESKLINLPMIKEPVI